MSEITCAVSTECSINQPINQMVKAGFDVNMKIKALVKGKKIVTTLAHATLAHSILNEESSEASLFQMDLLLNNGYNKDTKCVVLGSLLHCTVDDTSDLRSMYLLKKGVNPFLENSDGVSFLEIAVMSEKHEIVKEIIERYPRATSVIAGYPIKYFTEEKYIECLRPLEYVSAFESSGDGRSFVECLMFRKHHRFIKNYLIKSRRDILDFLFLCHIHNDIDSAEFIKESISEREDHREIVDTHLRSADYLKGRPKIVEILKS